MPANRIVLPRALPPLPDRGKRARSFHPSGHGPRQINLEISIVAHK
jgi:hypothetical protein